MTYTSFIDALLAENVSSKPTCPYNQPPLTALFWLSKSLDNPGIIFCF